MCFCVLQIWNNLQIGWKHLKDDVALMGTEDRFTSLVWPLGGEDPDDAFSSVPYEKVSTFTLKFVFFF